MKLPIFNHLKIRMVLTYSTVLYIRYSIIISNLRYIYKCIQIHLLLLLFFAPLPREAMASGQS